MNRTVYLILAACTALFLVSPTPGLRADDGLFP
jgi:hypothetical protein